MDELFLNSTSPVQLGSFNFPEADGARRSHRHHSNGGNPYDKYDKGKKLQSENEYLRDRVRSCERGLGKLYQMIMDSDKPAMRTQYPNHQRSASSTYYDSNSLTLSPTLDPNMYNGNGMEFDNLPSPVPQVSMSVLQGVIEKLLSERDCLLSELDDLKQITEAAKRERVLAIDEKDQLLREAHSLRVTIKTTQTTLSNIEEERDVLNGQVRDLQDELSSLKKDNEKANEMRSLALEERSKIIAECSELQHELHAFQAERDELYEETLQLRSSLDELVSEKKKMLQDLDWLSKKSSGYEAVARNLKEQNEALSGKVHDTMEVKLKRSTSGQPWGFTIEGGRGSEFYHQDSSIVITGVANHTPALGILRFGDRIFSFGEKNFRNITRKEAAEMIRSCDLTNVTLEIGRASANIKPTPEEIKIPGKKDFGFSYESRLFITSTEEGTAASDLLVAGDEIIQVQGKSAFNMKPSVLKQLLKSCKDGVTLTIQRPAGINLPSIASMSSHKTRQTSLTVRETSEVYSLSLQNGSKQSQRHSNEFVQSPGTPKSIISESSAGYHSLNHSMPSDLSSTLIPVGPDSKTGQVGSGDENGSMSRQRRQFSKYLSDSACFQDQNSFQFRTGSMGQSGTLPSLNRTTYRNRPADFYPPRRNTTSSSFPSRASSGPRLRTTSMSAFRSNPSSPSPRMDPMMPRYSQKVTGLSRGLRPITTVAENSNKSFSMSADNLDSDTCIPEVSPRRSVTSHSESHDPPNPQQFQDKHHVTSVTTPTNYSRGHLSMSMGNMQTHV